MPSLNPKITQFKSGKGKKHSTNTKTQSFTLFSLVLENKTLDHVNASSESLASGIDDGSSTDYEDFEVVSVNETVRDDLAEVFHQTPFSPNNIDIPAIDEVTGTQIQLNEARERMESLEAEVVRMQRLYNGEIQKREEIKVQLRIQQQKHAEVVAKARQDQHLVSHQMGYALAAHLANNNIQNLISEHEQHIANLQQQVSIRMEAQCQVTQSCVEEIGRLNALLQAALKINDESETQGVYGAPSVGEDGLRPLSVDWFTNHLVESRGIFPQSDSYQIYDGVHSAASSIVIYHSDWPVHGSTPSSSVTSVNRVAAVETVSGSSNAASRSWSSHDDLALYNLGL